MRFRGEKSRLLGALALLAPVPLPVNDVVGWSPVIAFMFAAALFLYRTERGFNGVLPYWVMNLMGAAYVPVLLADLTVLRMGKLLQPLVHLALFAMAVKLFALRREKDKWHLFLGLVFLFLASMGTSVHPAAIVYLAAFGMLTCHTLIRFAGLHSVATLMRTEREPRVPVARFLTGTILVSAMAAAPLFFLLPRLRQPYVYVPTGDLGGVVQVSGFSDRLDLGLIDRVRSLRTVVFRFTYETPPPPQTDMRFKVAAYDTFADGGWRRERGQSRTLGPERDGFFHIHDQRPSSWMQIWLRRGGDRLPLPVETAAIDVRGNSIVLDSAGEARFLLPEPGPVDYRAGMAAEPLVAGWAAVSDTELDRSAVTPRMSELAATVMGTGPIERRIRSLESYLRSEYAYSLDQVNSGSRPIESFLFDTRQGHCEFFASAMVLLLRSQGIAARLATGYLGADYNPLEEYMIVRQANAHAWVEAFVPDEDASAPAGSARGRWQVFDPTPADARPQTGRPGWATLMAQAYDYLLFRWDRYVLTYGFGDQVDVFVKLRDAWLRLWQAIRPEPDRAPSAGEEGSERSRAQAPKGDGGVGAGMSWSPWRAVPLVLILVGIALWFGLRRERFSATQAYRSLRARAEGDEDRVVPGWLGPLAVEERLNLRYPQAVAETRCIVSHYVRESFAGEDLAADELEAVRAALVAVRRKLKRT